MKVQKERQALNYYRTRVVVILNSISSFTTDPT